MALSIPVYRLHLNEPGMSGRWVEFRRLTASEVRAIEQNALKLASEPAAWRELALQNGIAKMVERYSDENEFAYKLAAERDSIQHALRLVREAKSSENEEERALVAAKTAEIEARLAEIESALAPPGEKQWTKASYQELQLPHEWDKVFTAKDTSALSRFYVREHELSVMDVARLEGKVLPLERAG